MKQQEFPEGNTLLTSIITISSCEASGSVKVTHPPVRGCTPGLEKAGVCPVAPLLGGSAAHGGNLKKVMEFISVRGGGRGVMMMLP